MRVIDPGEWPVKIACPDCGTIFQLDYSDPLHEAVSPLSDAPVYYVRCIKCNNPMTIPAKLIPTNRKWRAILEPDFFLVDRPNI